MRQSGYRHQARTARTPRHANSAQTPKPRSASLRNQAFEAYKHLISGNLSVSCLQQAIILAIQSDASVPQTLIANGWISPSNYAAQTAAALELPLITEHMLPYLKPGAPFGTGQLPPSLRAHTATLKRPSMNVLVVDAGALSITELKRLARTHSAIALTSSSTIRALTLRDCAATFITNATEGLARHYPAESAVTGLTRQQTFLCSALFGSALVATVFIPNLSALSFLAILAGVFFVVILLRIAALILVLVSSAGRRVPQHRSPDSALPVYTVLIPLFQEAKIVTNLVHAILRLDYPRAKLDIKLIVEEIDTETRSAIRKMRLPGCIDVIVVPNGSPRTKPRALNYALHFAQGDFSVIFDAEDRPEPDQLRLAQRAFQNGPKDLACCQARLNLYNPNDSWFTRQFTVEYSALFDALLPAYRALRFPIPLGGTSNHFRTSVLRQLAGWDAYNVTEDADLGIRLTRHGYKTTVIRSTTHEEAPIHFRHWLPQRTRWIKGWIQTWFVHTRDHRRLRHDLGLWSTIGFHAVFIGQIASFLIHPFFYILAAYYAWNGELFSDAASITTDFLRTISLSNLVSGYAASIALGLVAIVQRRHLRLLLTPFTMPLYWLLISAAAYRAIWQLWRNPFHWEKLPMASQKCICNLRSA